MRLFLALLALLTPHAYAAGISTGMTGGGSNGVIAQEAPNVNFNLVVKTPVWINSTEGRIPLLYETGLEWSLDRMPSDTNTEITVRFKSSNPAVASVLFDNSVSVFRGTKWDAVRLVEIKGNTVGRADIEATVTMKKGNGPMDSSSTSSKLFTIVVYDEYASTPPPQSAESKQNDAILDVGMRFDGVDPATIKGNPAVQEAFEANVNRAMCNSLQLEIQYCTVTEIIAAPTRKLQAVSTQIKQRIVFPAAKFGSALQAADRAKAVKANLQAPGGMASVFTSANGFQTTVAGITLSVPTATTSDVDLPDSIPSPPPPPSPSPPPPVGTPPTSPTPAPSPKKSSGRQSTLGSTLGLLVTTLCAAFVVAMM